MVNYTRDQLKDLFQFFDVDGSGTIPLQELKAVFKELGCDDELAQMKADVRHNSV